MWNSGNQGGNEASNGGDYELFDMNENGDFAPNENGPKKYKDSVAEYVRVTRTLSDAAFDPDTGATAGIPGAVFNFTNSIVGAGIIGLPYAILQSGFYFGVFLLVLVAFLTDYGVRNLVASGVRHDKHDYELITEWAFGKKGYYLVVVFMFLFAYGAMVAYHVVIGDTIPTIVTYYGGDNVGAPLTQRWFIVCLFSVVFMLPLSLLKHMASLSMTSFFSVFSVFFIVIAVCVESPIEANDISNEIDYDKPLTFIKSSWFSGAGTMAFAYVCHHSTFIVYSSLKEQTIDRWNKISHIAISIASFLSLVLSLVSFLYFRETTESDILNSFSEGNTLINVARIFLAITMVFTFPMEQFVARHCILELLEASAIIQSSKNNLPYYSVTLILWSSSLAIGASVDDLGIVLSLVGAFAASTLGFIMPGFIILKANPERTESKMSCQFLGPAFLIVFGICVLILGTVSSFVSVG